MVVRQSKAELTASERAVLLQVERGVHTAEGIEEATGAARWWIDLNLRVLVHSGFLTLYARDPEPAYSIGPRR